MRRGLALCLALALMIGLIPAYALAEGGRASTPLSAASDAQKTNIALSVAALNGTRVERGETFSFNATVGPRTEENGYVAAINGRGAKKLGGGVSQVATTLYLALKQLDDIEYLQKRTYGNEFADDYVDSGYDAILTDFKQNVDFRFVNGYGAFFIHIWMTDSAIECELTPLVNSAAPESSSGSAAKVDSAPTTAVTAAPAPPRAPTVRPAPTSTPTVSPEPTSAPTVSPEPASTPTASPEPTNAPTASPEPTNAPTASPEPTNAPTASPEPTSAPTVNPAPTSAPTASPTPTSAPTASPAPTSAPTASPAPTNVPANPDLSDEDLSQRTLDDDPDILSSAQIPVNGSDAMLHNIALACSGIYGVVLKRGETFSFNALVGPNTEDAGYEKAADGRGEEITGGGVSVVASALWLAVKEMDDIAVTKKATYGKAFSQTYVSSGDDAIMTDYARGTDFRFRYKGRGGITIYTYVSEGVLLCEIRHNNS